MRRNGFTLIELLVVIGIIAALAGLLIPVIGIARKAARDAKCQALLGQVKAALSLYRDSNGVYPENDFTNTYATNLGSGSGPTASGKTAVSVSESSWKAVNAALKLQLATIDRENFRIDPTAPVWKSDGPYIVDPYGSPGLFKVIRYRPARYYSLTGASTTPLIDSDNPPNPDSYQLWSCGWNLSDEFGEKLYGARKGDDQANWSAK